MSGRQRLAVALAALVGGVVFVVLNADGANPYAAQTPVAIHALQLAIALLYVIAGLLIWCRHPGRLIGRLMTAAGLVLVAGSAAVQVGNSAVFTAGMVAQSLFVALLAHASVAYPSGRLSSGFDRLTVIAAYTVILGENLLADLSECAGCPRNILLIPLGEGTLDRALAAQRAVTLVAIVLFMAALIRHFRQGSAAARRALAPVVITAIVMASAHAGLLLVALGAPFGQDRIWWLATLGTTAAVPIAYLGARLRSRLAGAGVGRLVVEIGKGPLPGQLRTALARGAGRSECRGGPVVTRHPELRRWRRPGTDSAARRRGPLSDNAPESGGSGWCPHPRPRIGRGAGAGACGLRRCRTGGGERETASRSTGQA